MPVNVRSLSMRGRVALAAVAVAGAGLGLAPLASAAPAAPTNAASLPVIRIASTYAGVPYRWGGTSTRGFDCSGYVQFVFRKLGVNLPRTAQQQYNTVKHITQSQLQVGDLVFFGGPGWVYHVGIYAGQGMFWDAPHTGSSVRLQKIWSGRKVYGRVQGLKVPAVTPTTVPVPVLLPVVVPVFGVPTTTTAPVGQGDPGTEPAAPTGANPAATTAPVATAPTSSAPTSSPSTSPSPTGTTATPTATPAG